MMVDDDGDFEDFVLCVLSSSLSFSVFLFFFFYVDQAMWRICGFFSFLYLEFPSLVRSFRVFMLRILLRFGSGLSVRFT